MKKILSALGLASLLLTAAAAGAAQAGEAPEAIALDACGDKQAAVDFPHAAHLELTECATCHHTQEGLTAESGDEVQTCTSCHLEPAEAETPSCSEMSLKKNPFHIGCVGCHKESAAETAPTKCTECHPKAD